MADTPAEKPRPRLKLIPKTAADARAMVEAMPVADRAQLSPEWLKRVYSPELDDPWTFGYTVVREADGVKVGQCGFKGPPDGRGVVEIAYGTAPAHEGQGYATEAAQALVRIAFLHEQVRTVRAHTFAAKNASTRVLAKTGFRFRGEAIDPEDGRVWRWELKRADTT